MVITLEIGQSAVLLPKTDNFFFIKMGIIFFISPLAGYGRYSETERVLVSNEDLANLSSLKIQSTLFGNLEDFIGR
jgi:hypothetical protein